MHNYGLSHTVWLTSSSKAKLIHACITIMALFTAQCRTLREHDVSEADHDAKASQATRQSTRSVQCDPLPHPPHTPQDRHSAIHEHLSLIHSNVPAHPFSRNSPRPKSSQLDGTPVRRIASGADHVHVHG